MPKLLLRTTRSADVCRQCLYFRLWETEFQPQNNIFFAKRKKLLTETETMLNETIQRLTETKNQIGQAKGNEC